MSVLVLCQRLHKAKTLRALSDAYSEILRSPPLKEKTARHPMVGLTVLTKLSKMGGEDRKEGQFWTVFNEATSGLEHGFLQNPLSLRVLAEGAHALSNLLTSSDEGGSQKKNCELQVCVWKYLLNVLEIETSSSQVNALTLTMVVSAAGKTASKILPLVHRDENPRELAILLKEEVGPRVLDRCVLSLHNDDFDLRAVGNLLWGIARISALPSSSRTFSSSLAAHPLTVSLFKRLEEGEPREGQSQAVSMSLWASASIFNLHPDENVKKILRASSKVWSLLLLNLPGFSPQNYGNILWALASIGFRGRGGRGGEGGGEGGRGLLFADSRSVGAQVESSFPEHVVSKMLSRMLKGGVLLQMKSQEVTNAAWGIAKMGISPQDALPFFQSLPHLKVDKFSERQLANLLWALATSADPSTPPSSSFVLLLADRLSASLLSSCSSSGRGTLFLSPPSQEQDHALSNAAWAVATLKLESPSLTSLVRSRVVSPHPLDSQHVANSCWALGAWGQFSSSLCLRASERFCAEARNFGSRHVLTLGWLMAKTQLFHRGFFEHLFESTSAESLQPSQCVAFLWVLAIFKDVLSEKGLNYEEFAASCLRQALGVLEERGGRGEGSLFSPPTSEGDLTHGSLAQMTWSAAVLELPLSPQEEGWILRILRDPAWEEVELPMLMSCAGRQKQAIDLRKAGRKGGFSDEGITQAYWAFASLEQRGKGGLEPPPWISKMKGWLEDNSSVSVVPSAAQALLGLTLKDLGMQAESEALVSEWRVSVDFKITLTTPPPPPSSPPPPPTQGRRRERGLIIEVHGPQHYVSDVLNHTENENSIEKGRKSPKKEENPKKWLSGRSLMKKKILERGGWRVLEVSTEEMKNKKTIGLMKDFILKKMGEEGVDSSKYRKNVKFGKAI